MISTDALIRNLAGDLAPVQRRSARREAGSLMALGGAELLLILAAHGMRPDMGRVILSPFMLWKVGSLALLAGAACTAALRSFVPPVRARSDMALTAALACLAIICGMVMTPAADRGRALLARLDPAHGLVCTAAIVVLALPMVALLAGLMRRAAPVNPGRSAGTTGLAASISGALVFTDCCPMNDPLYIIVWYSAGVAANTATSRWLLPRRFRL